MIASMIVLPFAVAGIVARIIRKGDYNSDREGSVETEGGRGRERPPVI